jgi:chemotaxis protein methyltransferase CheR
VKRPIHWPYSSYKRVPDLANWHITILATDINGLFLEKAAAGIYSEWSFRGAPGWVKERYFKKIREGRYEILPSIREMVKFTQLNLVEGHDPSPANLTSAIDLVLCRNVLMYFVPWQVNRVLDNFYSCLIDDGWLIVSPTEISYLQTTPFSMVNFPGAMLHQKRQVQAEAARAPVSSTDHFPVPEMDTGFFLPRWPPQNNGISQGPGAKSQPPTATPGAGDHPGPSTRSGSARGKDRGASASGLGLSPRFGFAGII